MLSMETRYACLGELEVKRWLFFLGFINICKISFLVSVGGGKKCKKCEIQYFDDDSRILSKDIAPRCL